MWNKKVVRWKYDCEAAHKSHLQSPRQSASQWPPHEAVLSDNAAATIHCTSGSPATKEPERAAAFIAATRSAHDRDFPLGARWGGWCKSERAALGRGHHSSFHLGPPGGRAAVTCSIWMEGMVGRKHSRESNTYKACAFGVRVPKRCLSAENL